MKQVLASFWGLHIYGYGVGLVVVVLSILFLFWRELRRTSYNEEKLMDMFFASVLGAFIVGRIWFLLVNYVEFEPTLLKAVLVFTFPGVDQFGVWVGFFSLWLIFCLRHKMDFYAITRLLALPVLFGYFVFNLVSYLYNGDLSYIYAAPLVFIGLWCLGFIENLVKQAKLPLKCVFYYLIGCVGVTQFVIDFFKSERIYLWGQSILSLNQLLYGVVALISATWWVRVYLERYAKSQKKK